MRTVKILLAVLAAVVIFNSCKKDYAEPTITWTPDKLSHFVEFEDAATFNIDLNITFAAEAGIKEIAIWKHVYHSGETTPVTTILDAPTGYDALTTFDYNFVTSNVADDFSGGVTKIVYEFEVTDASETPQMKSQEYSLIVSNEVYTVTFEVEDEQGNAITDANVTFDDVEMTSAPYDFTYIPADGTYAYSVAKAGYVTQSVSDFVMPANDTTVTVVLVETLPDAWTGPVVLALQGQTSWASYNGTAVTIYESETIGFAFTSTTATTVTVTKTANCAGWVLVDDITSLNTEASLEAAYNAGTELNTYDLPYDQHKTFATRYFISKIGTNYILVEYIAGHRDITTGNIVAFQYKD